MKSTKKFDYPDLPAGVLRSFLKLRQTPLTVVDFKEDFQGEEISDPARLCREPAVSVVTITYNHEKYIAQCLEFILAQKTTFPFEIIVGEDCSTDNTRQIVLDYQKKYPEFIRVIVSDRNVGVTKNRVRVALRTRGQFIASCEGDDYWTDPEKLQRQYETMSSDESIGLCFADGEAVAEPDSKRLTCRLSQVKPGLSDVNEIYEQLLLSQTGIYTASAMVRNFTMQWNAESLFAHFIFSLSMGDLPTWLLTSYKRKTYYFPQKMVVRNCHCTSLVQTWNRAVAWLDQFILLWYFAKRDGKLINKAVLTNMLVIYAHRRLSQRESIQVWHLLMLCFKCGLFFGRGGMLRRLLRSAAGRLKRIMPGRKKLSWFKLKSKIRNLLYHFKTADFQKLKEYNEAVFGTRTLPFLRLLSCSWSHGASFANYYELHFYEKTKQERKEYITTSLRHEITRQVNDPEKAQILKNKIRFSHFYRDLLGREVLSLADLEKPLPVPAGRIVLKPVCGQVGKGIHFSKQKFSSRQEIRDYIVRTVKNPQEYLCEEYIVQHPALARLNPLSVNTLRIVTFYDEAVDKVEVWSVLLRLGIDRETDNLATGGIAAPVGRDGIVAGPAVGKHPLSPAFDAHPVTGETITGYAVPGYREAVELAMEAALRLKEVKSVGWDVAITEQGPCLLEGNDNWCMTLLQIPHRRGLRYLADTVCDMYAVYD